MGRPRKPTQVLEMNGAYKKNPNRKRKDFHPGTELGEPPTYLSPLEKKIWDELRIHSPCKDLLAHSDKFVVELTCRLIAQMRIKGLTTGEMGHLRGLLASLGMTPSDRQKITIPDGDKDNPWAEI